jgi:hypothetical protein
MGPEMEEIIDVQYQWDLLEQVALAVHLFFITMTIWAVYKLFKKLWKGVMK